MIKISRQNQGFKVAVSEPGMGRGWSVFAADMGQAKQCVQHYYEGCKAPNAEACPFCADVERKAKRKQ